MTVDSQVEIVIKSGLKECILWLLTVDQLLTSVTLPRQHKPKLIRKGLCLLYGRVVKEVDRFSRNTKASVASFRLCVEA
jgi:hypothetical protein